METLAARFSAGVGDALAAAGVPWQVTRLGARAEYAFTDRPPVAGDDSRGGMHRGPRRGVRRLTWSRVRAAVLAAALPVPAGARRLRLPCLLLICMHRRYSAGMSVAITIRNVPDEVRNELAARAARRGQSMQEYVRGMLVAKASHPDPDDVIAQIRERVEATGERVSAAEILSDLRADRER